MGRVANKVAVVAGGALGIGRAASLLLAKEGARVAVVDVLEKEGREVAGSIKGTVSKAGFWKLDVSNEAEVEKVFSDIYKTFRRIDILVNSASLAGETKPADDMSGQDSAGATDPQGILLCTKHAAPYIKKTGGGSIINIIPVPGLESDPSYTALNAAIRLMSKADALVYAHDNIRVNSVNPGYVWTPLVEDMLKSSADAEAARKALDALLPLGHIGEPDDVAYAVLYLASNESKFVTGIDLVIDGGYAAK